MSGEPLEFKCPFCQRDVVVDFAPEANHVLHKMPMCPTYEALEADQYLDAAYEAIKASNEAIAAARGKSS